MIPLRKGTNSQGISLTFIAMRRPLRQSPPNIPILRTTCKNSLRFFSKVKEVPLGARTLL